MFTETIALQDKVSAPALQAAKQMMALDSAIDKTEQALTRAAATGGTSSKKYQALSKDLAGYKNALLAVPPQLIAEASAAQAAALATEKLNKEQGKAKAPAKGAAIAPATADTSGLTKSKSAVFDAANAMNVGKETISAAIGGIKASFASLAQGDIKGAINGITESIAGMAKMLDLVVPGLGQAVSAVITIAGGLAAAFAGVVKQGMAFAIQASEDKQAMLGLLDAMGDGITTGAQYEEMIDGLKDKYGIAKDSLVGWTKQLQAMGRTDIGQIEDDLLAIASAEAIVKGGGQALVDWTKKIELAAQAGGKIKIAQKALKDLGATGANITDVAKQMGMSVEDLTAALDKGTVDAVKFGDALKGAIEKKGAGPLAKMAASLPNLKKLLEESIGDMFEDIDVGPFLAQVKELFGIFSQGKDSGKAMKAGIQGAFQAIFDAATKVVPYIKHFLLDVVIWGLKAYIGLKPLIQFFKELSQSKPFIEAMKNALIGIGLAVASFMAPILGAVAVVTLLVGAFGAIATMSATVMASIVGFGAKIFGTLNGYIAEATSWGTSFIDGIIAGLGIGPIIAAVTNVANAAKDTFKSVLGIASPSKVMAIQGENVAAGAAEGIDEGAPEVSNASANLAKAASGGFSDAGTGAAAAGGAAASSGSGMTIESILIQITGGDKATMAELTEEGIALIFEKIALQQGLA